MGLRVWIWLLSLSVLWGGSFFFAKVAIGELGPLPVVFARVALTALALDVVLVATAANPFRRSAPWPTYFAMGFLNNVLPFSLIFWGQTEIASGLASILNATTPLFTLVIAHFLTNDEKIGGAKVAALLAGFTGVTVLIGPDLLVDGASVWGELACLGAALSYAFAGVYSRRFTGLPPLQAATGQITGGAIILLPLSLLVDHPWTFALPGWEIWGSFLAIALLNTAFAYFIYYKMLATAGVTYISLCTFIIPPLALKGPTLSIRRFGTEPLRLEDLLQAQTLTPEMAVFLEAAVSCRLNVVISGGTGSGKSTLLNALSRLIPNDERIVTIEDAAELLLQQRHVVPLETRPANVDGHGAVTTRDLVRNALRMRPDRIVIGGESPAPAGPG